MEKLENSHRKLNGLFEALKSRIGKKTNDNRMNDQNFQDILNLKDKMAKLETYFNKESTKNVQRVEELVKKLESTLDEKVAEFDKFKQEVSKARQERCLALGSHSRSFGCSGRLDLAQALADSVSFVNWLWTYRL